MTARRLDRNFTQRLYYANTRVNQISKKFMHDKQKVTLYLSADLHRQLKIRSAIDQEPMSELAQKAISFYLSHAEVVERSGVGHTHQVHNCPACDQTLVIQEGELLAVGGNRGSSIQDSSSAPTGHDEELVPC
jgi:competence CoiA-like predicted nuclease